MNNIQKTILGHLRSIFGLPWNTSGGRIGIVLGEPTVEVKLATRLLKNWHKYRGHFGSYPEIYKNILIKYFGEEVVYNPDKIPNEGLYNNRLKEMAKEYKIEIRNDHRNCLKRFWFTYPDKKDFYLISFFTNTTKASNDRLFPICRCGDSNDAKHSVNYCVEVKIDRVKLVDQFKRIFRSEGLSMDGFTLYDYLEYSYFTAELNSFKSKSRQEIVRVTKDTIFKVVVKKAELDDE